MSAKLTTPNSHAIGGIGQHERQLIRQRAAAPNLPLAYELYDPRTDTPAMRPGALDAYRLPSLQGNKRVYLRRHAPQDDA